MRSTRSVQVLSLVLSLLMVIGVITVYKETVSAATDATTGLTYTVSSGKATITGFTAPTGFNGALTIPTTLGGASVTELGGSAFASCTALTNITIPSGVTKINYSTFWGCTGLSTISVDAANAVYKSVGGDLYSKDGTTFFVCAKTKTGTFTIPSGVTGISAYAFDGCKNLTGITIQNGVTYIQSSVFRNCNGLTSLSLPASLRSVDLSAFDMCSNLTDIFVDTANTVYKSTNGLLLSKDGTKVICCPVGKSGSLTIPGGVQEVGPFSFFDCKKITSVIIPPGVTTLSRYAFSGCTSLTYISLPGSVTNVVSSLFEGCSSLTTISVDPTSPYYKVVEGILYSKDGTQLVTCPDTKAGYLSIPNGVINIHAAAFSDCQKLESIILPNTVTTIQNTAFMKCVGLKNFTIPQSVTSIGNMAFFFCHGLTSITIPSGVTSIGSDAFAFCLGMTDAFFYGNAPTLGAQAFSGCTSNFTVNYWSTGTGYSNPWNGYKTVPFDEKTVNYRTHVQDIGWQEYVSAGQTSGTSGQSKRLEAIQINLEGIPGGIKYRTHIQDIGWQDWVADDARSGTSGQSKRLEAIQIQLTGEAANLYDVYYRVHAQEFGWLDWAKNGESAGTAGYSYRLEAIEIKLVAKGGAAPGATTTPFNQYVAPVVPPIPTPPPVSDTDTVSYQTHVQDIGWQGYVSNGSIAGTSGESKRLETIQIKLENMPGGVEYRTHVQDIGWMDWVANDAKSGTEGQSKRLEAIQIQLTGEAAAMYDIYYCVHAQEFGWLDWAKNGEQAGTAGFSYRLEAIKIVLVPKGGPAPGPTTRAFVQG